MSGKQPITQGSGSIGNRHTGGNPTQSSTPSHRVSPYQDYSSLSSSAPYFSTAPRRGFDGRGRGQGQRYDNANNNNNHGGSFHGLSSSAAQGGERRPFNPSRGGRGDYNASLMEDGPRTKLSSFVTPHDAMQEQPAQHGASIVRSGSAPTEGGSILFFSSVQKKGGVFTASERETYAQLRQSRAIVGNNRGGHISNVVGAGIKTRNVARQFEELEKTRAAKEVRDAKAAVVASRRSRFTLASDEEENEGDSGNGYEDDEDEVNGEEYHSRSDEGDMKKTASDGEGEREVKRVRVEGLSGLVSSDSESCFP